MEYFNTKLSFRTNLLVSQRPGLRLVGILAFSTVLWVSLITGSLTDASDVNVSLSSGGILLVDHNQGCADAPKTVYLGFEVCNVSLEEILDLRVVLGEFTNPEFYLAGGQDSVQTIDTLGIGECTTLFWYTAYDCDDVNDSSGLRLSLHEKVDTVWQEFASHDEKIFNTSTINAGSGGNVLSSNLSSDAILGEILEYDCEYSFGSLNEGTPVIMQPAGNLDFHADCFQLVGSEVLYSEISDIEAGDEDQLYYSGVSKHTGSSNVVRMRYYFRNECAYKDTTSLSGYSGAISGTSFKRYNLGEEDVAVFPISWHWVKTEWAGTNGLLSWSASGVNDAEYYTIERAEGGSIFQVLDHFPASTLRTGQEEFAYTDLYAEEVRSPQILYRIRHVDIDGLTTYSEVKELKMKGRELAVAMFPNPTHDFLNIRYRNRKQEPGQLQIFNLKGQVLFYTQFGSQEDFQNQLNLTRWPSGKYFLEVQSGDRQVVKAFMKM